MKRKTMANGIAATAILIVTLTGCASNPDPHPAPVSVPEAFAGTPDSDTRADSDSVGWWHDFRDADLDSLVARTLGGNFDLRAAWARYRQAIAIADQAGARRLPQVNASTSAAKNRSLLNFGVAGLPSTATTEQFGLSLGAQYEVDLWGRLADLDKAAGYDAAASSFDAATMAMSLAARSADSWYRLTGQQEILDLISEQARTDSVYLSLVEMRFANGLSSALDVYQQRQQLLSAKAEIPRVEANIEVLQNQLAVLTGKTPSEFTTVPDRHEVALPPLPDTGLPMEVLNARPDVQAAWLRLTAADHRVAAAVKNRLPSINLSGSVGYSGGELSTVLDEWIYSLSASVVAPLFDGGTRKAAVRQQRAVVDAQLANLGGTMLVAMREVEDALARERKQRDYLNRVREQVGVSERLLDEARIRYREGLSDYLPVLNAVQTLHRTQQAEVAARTELVSYRIELYRALGGTWTDTLRNDALQTSTGAPGPDSARSEHNG